jgi:putative ABC transport system substrate-binding protein
MVAKSATSTIPIVFVTGVDPVKLGLVASFNHPGGNVTDVTFLTVDLEAKRLGLLHELFPQARKIVALVDPNSAESETQLRNVQPLIEDVRSTVAIEGKADMARTSSN